MSLFATNKFLSTIRIDPNSDDFIVIREGSVADSSFLTAYILREILSNDKYSLCFVNFHNTISHYQNLGKRINYNLIEKTDRNVAVTINALEDAMKIISGEVDADSFLRGIKNNIEMNINRFLEEDNSREIYLVVEDLSHLLDLGISFKNALKFVNFCTRLQNNKRVKLVLACHFSDPGQEDTRISNYLVHLSSIIITVQPLKTGACPGVSGVISVYKDKKLNTYHYKCTERDVKAFTPGAHMEALRI